MRHISGAGLLTVALLWCSAAQAQDEVVCIPAHVGIAPPVRFPAMPGWHAATEYQLLPDSTEFPQLQITGRILNSDARETAAEAAEKMRKNWHAPPVTDWCGKPLPPSYDPHLRETLAEVKGAGGRVFHIVSVTEPVSGWRDVLVFMKEGQQMHLFQLMGYKPDVEKNYADFTDMLQRYGAEAK